MAEFAEKLPITFKEWKKKSGYLICLAVKDLQALNRLCELLDSQKLKYVKFFEPDVDNQLTAIAISPHWMADEFTKSIRCAGQKTGSFDKHSPLEKAG